MSGLGDAPGSLWRGLRKQALKHSPQLKAFLRAVALNWTARPARQDREYRAWATRELGKPRPSESATAVRTRVSFIILPGADPEAGLVTLRSLLAQTRDGWEAIVAGPRPQSIPVGDARFRWLTEAEAGSADLANRALALASGAFVSLLGAGNWLWPDAMAAATEAIDEGADVWFSDDDVRVADGRHTTPTFKPGWNSELLHSFDYVGPFVGMRTAAVVELGGLKSHGDADAELWELHLRLARGALRWTHIPRVLCSRPAEPAGANEPAERAVLTDDLAARGYSDAEVTRNRRFSPSWDLHYALRGDPLVSIIIPSKNQLRVLRRCVESIYDKSTYRKFEVIVVDTGSDDPEVLAWYQTMTASISSFKVAHWPERPFSYSRSCNEGARIAEGSIFIMLNNDTEIITPDWIERMSATTLRPEIGAVGCLLYFPGGRRVQHAGVGLGIEGIAGNLLSGVYPRLGLTRAQALLLYTSHQLSAVTAACMAVRKDAFWSVGGFDEQLAVTFNDVDLCLRLERQGLTNVYEPHVKLLHHESISVAAARISTGTKEIDAARSTMSERWSRELSNDPMLNPHLSRDDTFCRFGRDLTLGHICAPG